MTIGSAALEDEGLTIVGDVLVHDGKVFATQPREHTVVVYTEDGESVGTFGGRGDGPGEFESVSGIGLLGELVWVADGDLRRVNYFDSQFGIVSSTSILHPSLPSGDPWIYGVAADGGMAIQFVRILRLEMPDVEAGRPRHMLEVGPGGAVRDTTTIITGRPGMVMVEEGNSVTFAGVPIADESLFSMASDGSGSVVVHRALAPGPDPHAFTVVRFDAGGDTLWDREYQYDPVRVPDRVVTDRVDESRERGSSRAYLRDLEDQLREREFFPAVTGVLAGEAGTTWLLRTTGVDLSEWAVLDASGNVVGRVERPPRSRLEWGGRDAIWFQEFDELQIPYLVRYEVHRP